MAVAAQPFTGAFVADRNHSSVLFSVQHVKVSRFRASFADVDARLAADEEGVRLEGRARVDSISIADPPELREHVVSGQDFFDAGEHPEIRFRSSRVELGDDGNARGVGELGLRGVFDLWPGVGDLPAYSEDLDRAEPPATVVRLRCDIADADALIFATPEYNSSVPGGLKNALDWASRPFATSALRREPVAVIG